MSLDQYNQYVNIIISVMNNVKGFTKGVLGPFNILQMTSPRLYSTLFLDEIIGIAVVM